MSGSLFYWDACTWISWLTGQERPGTQKQDLIEVAQHVEAGKANLVTSTLSFAEVLQTSLTVTQEEIFQAIFRRRRCIAVDVTRPVAEMTRRIRDFYQKRKDIDGLPTVGTADAIHLATAIIYKADEFHTFDQHDSKKPNRPRRALIPLSGNVAGHNLKVCFPALFKQTPALPSMSQQSWKLGFE